MLFYAPISNKNDCALTFSFLTSNVYMNYRSSDNVVYIIIINNNDGDDNDFLFSCFVEIDSYSPV